VSVTRLVYLIPLGFMVHPAHNAGIERRGTCCPFLFSVV
jgi:hypothetical protein